MFFRHTGASRPKPPTGRRTFAAALVAIAVGAALPSCLQVPDCGEEDAVPPKCLPTVDAGIKEDALFDAEADADADADADAKSNEADSGN